MKPALMVMALCVATVLPQAARAELLILDWKSAGDRLLIKDSITGLQWLRVSHTAGQSFEEVSARLSGDLSGFSYATATQVETMFGNARAEAPDGIRQLVELWGPGRDWQAGLRGVSAITRTPHAQWGDSMWVAEAAYQTDPIRYPETTSFATATSGSITRNFGHRHVGSALVRVSAIPELPTATLAVVGFAAIYTLMRQRRLGKRQHGARSLAELVH